MQESNFERLMRQYLHNELTEEESAKFTAWLNLVEKERGQNLFMSSEAKAELFRRITGASSTVEHVVALYPRKPRMKKLLSSRWLQIAATVLVMVLSGITLRYFLHEDRVSTIASAQEKIILMDGTIVWIDQQGEFSYYEKDGGRYAKFTGDALFEVAKNPNSPFMITCGSIHVSVIGTSFRLKADANKIELSVLTGLVNVTSTADNVGVSIKANEKVVYTKTGILTRSNVTARDLSSINAEYQMKFEGSTMQHVMDKIEDKFDVEISAAENKLNDCHISADFTDYSLEETLNTLRDMLDITYTVDKNQIVISGKGC